MNSCMEQWPSKSKFVMPFILELSFNIFFFCVICSSIKEEFRQLLSDLCTEQILMLLQPTEVKMRKKHRKVATEVADLKIKLSQSLKNIVLSNREIRLLRYCFMMNLKQFHMISFVFNLTDS